MSYTEFSVKKGVYFESITFGDEIKEGAFWCEKVDLRLCWGERPVI